jgi:hypothetical protein
MNRAAINQIETNERKPDTFIIHNHNFENVKT